MIGYEEFLAVACEETGLDDFGDNSFREGLEILTRALRDEADLNAVGEAALRQQILRHLEQRLHVEDWYKRHPEIEGVPIKAPLIGVSLPRTGSTALSYLLAEDLNARSLRTWESDQPCPPPCTVTGPDPRIARIEGTDRQTITKSHLPSSSSHAPTECLELMALDFKSQIFQALARIPSYSDWLLDADLTSTYRYERRVLKLLQWGFPAKPWRLKTPMHLLFLNHLSEAFPDARFVMTHRDPTEVLLSVAHLYADLMGNFTDKVDLQYIGELNVRHWSVGMDRALAFRADGHDERFYDIHFRTMQRDPIGEVRGLYAWLGEPVAPEFEAGMDRWWKQNAQNREPSLHPDAATYGLNLNEIRPLFSDYTTRMAAWTKR
jgi:hypothetical protein